MTRNRSSERLRFLIIRYYLANGVMNVFFSMPDSWQGWSLQGVSAGNFAFPFLVLLLLVGEVARLYIFYIGLNRFGDGSAQVGIPTKEAG